MLSPWLHELQRIRPVDTLHGDMTTDTVIVGAGIAGVTTAYYILKNTAHSVALIEASMVAHGATGHNAGQVTSYFERPFADVAQEFGLSLAARGQQSIEGAWTLLETIIQEAHLTTPFFPVTGYAGLSTETQVLEHLHNNALKIEAGLTPEMLYIDEEWIHSHDLQAYTHIYTTLPQKDILAMLETEDVQYIAALSGRKGCINSARLCEELIGYLLEIYPQRFVLAEHTPVHTVELSSQAQYVQTEHGTITCQKVVLCTNGFEHFSITHREGVDINTGFHAMIHGNVGHMVGYTQELNTAPTAKSYFPSSTILSTIDDSEPDAYYYMTRRPFEIEKNTHHNLICFGGPEERLSDTAEYSRDIPPVDTMMKELTQFIDRTVPEGAPKTFAYRWHGLMGYTPNNIRRVGPEPKHPALLYNLGCNGVGILPSIFGAHRISRYLNDEAVEPSIFDIPE